MRIDCNDNTKLFLFNSSPGAYHSSPAPPNPFLVYGPNFPTPGGVTCAAQPAICEKSAYRTLDGTCNHLENPLLGVANTRYWIIIVIILFILLHCKYF